MVRKASTPLKRVNLMLDEALIEKLRETARLRQMSMSELVRRHLARDLGLEATVGAAARIRRLREQLKPMPDSTGVIREARSRGW